ncbi:MAG: TonB family protein [Saprospiraceae bacterium]|nr:TonB family protein [Saprospiraceae bacterium]
MEKKKKFLPKPEYIGGPKALGKFITDNLKYPESAIKDKIQGVVVVRIEIDFHGKVIDAKVLSSLQDDCNQEAMRIARLLQFHVAKVRNIKISFFKNINIHFQLPQAPVQTVYSYTVQTNSPTDSEKPGNTHYSYTITVHNSENK